MSKPFDGMCEGGPLEGQRLVHNQSRRRVELISPILRGDPLECVKVQQAHYVWTDGVWHWVLD